MEDDVFVEKRYLDEVLTDADITERIKYILENNPFSKGENHVAMLRGMVNGEDGGRTYPYLSHVLVNQIPVSAYTGTTFYVSKEYRKYMLGIMIPEVAVQLAETGITYGAGLSRDARPVYIKYLKSIYFPLKRFLYLRNARSLIESKVGARASTIISPICNFILSIIHGFHSCKNRIMYYKYKVKEVLDDQEYKIVEDIIRKDQHLFQEEHNAEWFKWTLNAPSSHTGNHQKLFLIYYRNEPVGFWLMKVRYAEKIQKFKNLYVGTITEWGSISSGKLKEKDVLSIALHYFPNNVDVIQTFTENRENVSLWPCIIKEIGESNFFINIAKPFRNMYLGYDKIENWRLRPAMADTMFD